MNSWAANITGLQWRNVTDVSKAIDNLCVMGAMWNGRNMVIIKHPAITCYYIQYTVFTLIR